MSLETDFLLASLDLLDQGKLMLNFVQKAFVEHDRPVLAVLDQTPIAHAVLSSVDKRLNLGRSENKLLVKILLWLSEPKHQLVA